jgi:hypothetical protein
LDILKISKRANAVKNSASLDDSASEVTLRPVAARLVELAPDKGALLQGFNRQFHPSHWSGSLAQTRAPHLALVKRLVGHADSVVAAWAQEALGVMRQRIEYDRSMDITREQSFEQCPDANTSPPPENGG